MPVHRAAVRAPGVTRLTDTSGIATLMVRSGPITLVVTRIGLVPDTVQLDLRPRQDTTLVVEVEEQPEGLASVVIAATRAERRVEDSPLRVEVVDEEELAEKVAMTPGDIVMMLNETSGLRVQMTSPSLGGAGVRIQGLQPRYSFVLNDGLPLYGQASGLGLLQIPPMDLGRAEVIKGSASALYGPSALGGVINLVSRRPGADGVKELLLNQTSRGGTDAVFFGSTPTAENGWGATFLASGHRQTGNDIDRDGWIDMPEYTRGVFRPRAFYDNGGSRSFFATLGYTREDRTGGTLAGRNVPGAGAYVEGLETSRLDGGLSGRMIVGGRDVVSFRASAMRLDHAHQFGSVAEDDAHETGFAEISAAMPRGRFMSVVGAAYQMDYYENRSVNGFDYSYHVPALFAQTDVDLHPSLVVSGSARVDRHDVYGTNLSPRVSLLLRAPAGSTLAGWSSRLSAGGGTFAPTPFTEETEASGLSPLATFTNVKPERAQSASFDVGGPVSLPVGTLEVNAAAFASRVTNALETVPLSSATPNGATRIALVNAPISTNTSGVELLARWLYDDARFTASYAYTNARAWDSESGGLTRVDVPLTPRHTAGLVASLEKEEDRRFGLELYYTGSQRLKDNPYRAESKPYVVLGLLGEKWIGKLRVFVNAENLLDVRQTRTDPLVLPARGAGGRWTTDVWSFLDGRTFNAGVRASF
jgi:iron complex outermembrane receptor protein